MNIIRRSGFILVLFAVFFISTLSANAALELRGTDSQGNRLIYDTDFNITWYDYSASVASWDTQMNWASTLSVSGEDLVGVYDDWRLPTALNQNGTGPCSGYNCTGSEMGHLFYTELGNVAGYASTKTGDFQHLQAGDYWSGTDYATNTDDAWYFYTGHGSQGISLKGANYYAIAVRAGDVSIAVVPEPISSILFIVGGATLGFRRFRKKIKNI